VARRRLVNALVREDRPDEAKPHAEMLFESAHGVDEARVLAGIHLRTGDSSAARELALQVRAENPGGIDAAEMALQTLTRCGEGDLAWQEMKDLTQENPGDYRAWILLCVAHETEGGREEALDALRQASQVAPPDSLDALLDLADGFSRLDRHDEAEEILAGARRLDREPARVWYAVASVRERARDFRGAESAIRRVLELEPESAQALNFLGYLYADQNRNLEEAVRLIRQALEQEPDNGFIVDSLGWAYFRLGRLDSARAELERAIRLVGEDPIILEHLGDVQLAGEDRDAAHRTYRRALELDPENETLQEKVNESR
jgi:Flp pilus assembly protein TadD